MGIRLKRLSFRLEEFKEKRVTMPCACVLAALCAVVLVSAEAAIVPATGLPIKPANGCFFEGKWYQEHAQNNTNPCRPCTCYSGQMACAIVDCFFEPCVDAVHDPKHCCPTCPNGRNCRAPDGHIIPADGTLYKPDRNTQCTCSGHMFGSAQAECLKTATLMPLELATKIYTILP